MGIQSHVAAEAGTGGSVREVIQLLSAKAAGCERSV